MVFGQRKLQLFWKDDHCEKKNHRQLYHCLTVIINRYLYSTDIEAKDDGKDEGMIKFGVFAWTSTVPLTNKIYDGADAKEVAQKWIDDNRDNINKMIGES